jgi:hypothetical protein
MRKIVHDVATDLDDFIIRLTRSSSDTAVACSLQPQERSPPPWSARVTAR